MLNIVILTQKRCQIHLKKCYFLKKKKTNKKKDNLKTPLGDIENNEDTVSELSRFNTKVSLKARLYYRNKALMDKLYSKGKIFSNKKNNKEIEKESEIFLDILTKNNII